MIARALPAWAAMAPAKKATSAAVAPTAAAPTAAAPTAAERRDSSPAPPAARHQAPSVAAPSVAAPVAERAAVARPSLLPSDAELASAAARLRAMRERAVALEHRDKDLAPPAVSPAPFSASVATPTPAAGSAQAPRATASVDEDVGARGHLGEVAGQPEIWRAALARYGGTLMGPLPAAGGELLTLIRRLDLPETARRAAVMLYARWLAGTPFVAVAYLAELLGESGFREALGTGALGKLALLRHRDGAVAFRRCVVDALDGRPWGAIRTLGERMDGASVQLRRDVGRVAVAAWPAWAARLGKVALVTGKLRRAIVEARLAELVAVTFDPLSSYPSPWPAGARLLVVCDAPGGLTAELPRLELTDS
ncbi:MAG: hypothetical protein IPI49_04025 [Myxococcales bacterium]|nr:hypothetical protein [Myxococcales bacterium]